MRLLSNRRATKLSCIVIVAALGLVSGPAWADDREQTSIDPTSQVFAAVEMTGAQALRDDEMGELRGGFLGNLGGFLGSLPETNTAIVQDGDEIDSQFGPGPVSADIDNRPRFYGSATANSTSSSGSSSSSSGSSFSSFSSSSSFTRTSFGTTIR